MFDTNSNQLETDDERNNKASLINAIGALNKLSDKIVATPPSDLYSVKASEFSESLSEF